MLQGCRAGSVDSRLVSMQDALINNATRVAGAAAIGVAGAMFVSGQRLLRKRLV